MELTTAQARAQRAGEMARIGARVRELRKARGLTQQQLSDVVGLHRVNLNKFENGRADLGVSRVRALAGALGVGPGQLFE
ncbi:Helix-turn-helix [Nocardioides exalbidus]|uniref:Helix-turn-helix n=1 Tax=Nocardioides exalbidus TaxID=402596 RepID=A0A1H4NZ68_9ACTN|nr:helix-turn-helix transcriptional regulator [Nocardioides exalbidus]SEC00138.1 Helix-turn-helix [Nocardioides exalbidus]